MYINAARPSLARAVSRVVIYDSPYNGSSHASAPAVHAHGIKLLKPATYKIPATCRFELLHADFSAHLKVWSCFTNHKGCGAPPLKLQDDALFTSAKCNPPKDKAGKASGPSPCKINAADF